MRYLDASWSLKLWASGSVGLKLQGEVLRSVRFQKPRGSEHTTNAGQKPCSPTKLDLQKAQHADSSGQPKTTDPHPVNTNLRDLRKFFGIAF